jgi:glyoxylase-like metal-dependent hydrolase (beta-lactamase superfamily II)
LIDAGWSKCGPLIKETAEALFGVNTRPAAMLLTHVHPDHAGSALELAQMWELPVYMHPDEMPLTAGTLAALEGYPASPLDRWVILPVMRALPRRRREAIMATGSLKERARPFDPRAGVPGLPDWECIPTPGHSPSHVSFFRPSDRVLITGDAVVTMKVDSVWGFLLQQQGLSGPPWYTTSSWRTAQESIAALARLEPRVLATGHGSPMSGPGTARELRAFANHCRAPDPPTSDYPVAQAKIPREDRDTARMR